MADEYDRVQTPVARLSYPALFKAQTNKERPDAAPKYSAVLIFPKSADIAELKRIAKNALTAGAKDPNAVFGGDDGFRSPFRDGNKKKDKKTGEIMDGYENTIYFSASTTQAPGVVDETGKGYIFDAEVIYAGCHVRAQVHAFFYDQKGNKGVAFGLDNIQKVGEGEKFSSRPDAREIFGAAEGHESSSNEAADDDDFLS
jgi:hypothetical protein